MRKFILIDPTIKDNSGHHLEYAMRVLQAAKRAGMHTVLATNATSDPVEADGIDEIDGAYTCTYWQNQIGEEPYRLRHRHLTAMFLRIRRALTFMRLTKDIPRQTLSLATGRTSGTGVLERLGWWSVSFIPSARKRVLATVFAAETLQLLKRVRVQRDDVAFVPTMGEVELAGISRCGRDAACRGVNWHLLFRRNLFEGREPSYAGQVRVLAHMRRVLSEFGASPLEGAVRFWTDTEALSEQYNTTGVFEFGTLPVPCDDEALRLSRGEPPLVVSYVGDVRDEKGFHHLADLVIATRAAGYGPDRLRFRFQSDIARGGGRRLSRAAKHRLRELSGPGLELVEGPLDTRAYGNLVHGSDIILIPYDANAYYARSSGIFVEALASGIPVLCPAKSWMGKELTEADLQYWRGLEVTSAPGPWLDFVPDAGGCGGIRLHGHADTDRLLFLRYRLKKAEPGSFVEIRQMHGPKRENTLPHHGRVAVVDCRFTKATIAIPLQAASSGDAILELCAQPDGQNAPQFESFEYRSVAAPNRPRAHAISVSFVDHDDAAVSLAELVSQYSGYSRACGKAAAAWRERYSPVRLVAELMDPNSSLNYEAGAQ